MCEFFLSKMLDCIYDATMTSPPRATQRHLTVVYTRGRMGYLNLTWVDRGWSFKPNKRFLLEEFEGKESAFMSVRPFSPLTMMLTRNKNPPTKELILDFAKFL